MSALIMKTHLIPKHLFQLHTLDLQLPLSLVIHDAAIRLPRSGRGIGFLDLLLGLVLNLVVLVIADEREVLLDVTVRAGTPDGGQAYPVVHGLGQMSFYSAKINFYIFNKKMSPAGDSENLVCG